jgi:hypothetical protein
MLNIAARVPLYFSNQSTFPQPILNFNYTALLQMIVVAASRAHVMKFLPLSCELSIFVAVTVIF